MHKSQLKLSFENPPAPAAGAVVEAAVPEPVGHWRPIHYLGSKLRLVGEISTLVDQVEPRRRPICDLFSGSATLAAAFARSRRVVSVDIQEYARVLASATFNATALQALSGASLARQAKQSTAFADLNAQAFGLVQHETACLQAAEQGDIAGICDLLSHGSLLVAGKVGVNQAHPKLAEALSGVIQALHARSSLSGTVTLRHFGGLYFSYYQALCFDVLLSVARSQPTAELRDGVTAAVLSTASEVVNTVGKHFAQPIRPTDAAGKPKRHVVRQILRDRRLDVFEIFESRVRMFQGLPALVQGSRAIQGDYLDALRTLDSDIGIIYADPPYTRDHYSRFYHALETMCLGDDPAVSTTNIRGSGRISRGIYRADRHQSPFSIISQAPDAFRQLFVAAHHCGLPLVLSYSPLSSNSKPRPRVMTVEDMVSIAKEVFARVRVEVMGRIAHSKLNHARHNAESTADGELCIICE